MWLCSDAGPGDDLGDLIVINVTCSYSHTTGKVWIEGKETQKLLTCDAVKNFYMPAWSTRSRSHNQLCMFVTVKIAGCHRHTATKTLKGKETAYLCTGCSIKYFNVTV